MKKKVLIVILILFLPITLVISLFFGLGKIITGKRIHNYLSNIAITDIDAISGYQFEEIISHLFKFFGYKTKLTKRSGDYGVDIFANNSKFKYCIQTKLYYNHNVGSSAIQEINTAKNYYECDYAIVVTNSNYSKQAIDMANKLNVVLFNRNDLVKVLQAYRRKNKKFMRRFMEEKLCLKY